MSTIQFHVWEEGEWFLAEVIGREDELYAQGISYADSLSNLFSVIKEIEEMDAEISPTKNQTKRFSLPKEGVRFELPCIA